jgi:hypothetical protein
LAQVWQTLQPERRFGKPHDLQKEPIEVERLLFRRARPAPVDLVDLLNSDMTQLCATHCNGFPARIISVV